MGILSGPFVTKEGASKLLHYSYHGEDRSILSKYYYYYWKKVSILFPLRFSPNVISVMGTLFPITAFLSVFVFGIPAPSWLFLAYGVCLFVYQTMDAVDGLQGRRVDMYNNPTTEIFDHGCDSVIMSVTTIMAAIGLRLIGKKLSVLFVVASLCGFYFPTWEHLSTGVMIFRGGLLNPTEGLVMSQLMFVVTSFFPDFWIKTPKELLKLTSLQRYSWMRINTPFLSYFGVSSIGLSDIAETPVNNLLVYATALGAIYAAYSSISTVVSYKLHHKTSKNSSKTTNNTLLGSLAGLLPLLSICLCAYLWTLHLSQCSCTKIWRCQPLALLALLVPWNYAIYHIIIAEITDTRINIPHILIGQLPMFLPVVPLLPFFKNWELPLLILSLAMSLFIYSTTVRNALGEVCAVLGMKHFWSIPKFDNPAANELQKKEHQKAK